MPCEEEPGVLVTRTTGQFGKVFAPATAWQKIGTSREHWNLSRKRVASEGQRSMLVRPDHETRISQR